MIHTRSELIDWIKKNVNDRVLSNAIETGAVEHLGGFDPLPTSGNPGWMVQIKSPFGPTHLIAVAFDKTAFKLYWFRAPRIEWKHWVGGTNPLYAGDYPAWYADLRNDDTRFANIARCARVCPETDGSGGEDRAGPALADGDVSSAAPGQ